ncbi:MAG: Asp-tRNA(Asn)/Glu-tRNA(Gln) amidotransferase subunit GatC [Candidatus Woesearchaeota archaeon]|jgi:aspartyl-tRNA(Asn)/glutamyl-tRNA(Gln) amidotransferase subunit C|nr:Asp-tRNA(Asn)/Glu-tRNA(Gln) amidotransferase subunit GatC [Candidatus Woesearchaeota archaeon]MDP7458490.1 Asp-tRNA(Asn)/Glu-tRNA(Gln) amidotransferase subunit GatC [Candidatus Woesearchaeota archaeon]|tara:strand:- start:371 stop:655 length:285 start_codon:yes stop_codon:yes gene_type:complete
MKIDESMLKHVAEVARLKLTEAEIKKFLPELKEVLDTFSKISEVDTKNTTSSYQPVPLKNALREDKPKQCLTQEQALSLTTHKKEGYFKGPKAV